MPDIAPQGNKTHNSLNEFRRLWDLGYKRLVPIIPVDAELSEKSSLFRRPGSRGKAVGIRGHDGKFRGYDWVRQECSEADLDAWHAMGCGVGIKTGRQPDGTWLVGVDADTLLASLADKIEMQVVEHLGQLPARFGQRPKALFAARVSEEMRYTRVEFTGYDDGLDRVELLSEGRQFVAIGTHPKTGRPYEWDGGEMPVYDQIPVVEPAAITNFFDALRQELPDASPLMVEGATSAVSQEGLRGPLEAVSAAIRAIPNRNDLFPTRESYLHVGYALKAALPDHPHEAFGLFEEWCGKWDGGENETDVVEADWRRMKPPYRRGANWLYDLADRHGGGSFNAASVWFEAIADNDDNPFAAIGESPTTDDRPPLVPGEVTWDDLQRIPPRQWLYGYKVSRKYVTFIASPGGVGKTALTFGIALACATGEGLLHDVPHKTLRSWLLNLEDDQFELKRRLRAAVEHHDIDRDALRNIRLNSGRDRRFTIVKMNADGDFIILPDYEAVKAAIIQHGIDILIVDPYLRSHAVPENANEAQDEVMRLYAQIAEETNCAVILVHHVKKGAVAGDMDSLRGASTQGGGARAAYTLSPMSIEEAKLLGIPEQQRRLYVRIDDAKNNMAPPGAKAEWIKLESQKLDNGDEEYPAGDSVQVATKWSPPDKWDGLTGLDGEAALARLDAGPGEGERYSLRVQDKERWAGTVLVEEFGRTVQQSKEILDAWVKANVVEARPYRSPRQRKERTGLYVNGVAAASLTAENLDPSIFD